MKGKGTVMEIRSHSMVIMTNECGFEEIKKRNDITVGMEIDFNKQDIIRKNKSKFKIIATIAAAIILCIVSSLFMMDQKNKLSIPVAMLTIDINPSIALEINHKQEVLEVIPLNKDAEEFSFDSFKNQDVRRVIEEFVLMAGEKGYLQETDNYILLTTVSLEKEMDKEDQLMDLAEELKKNVEETFENRDGKSVVVLTLDSNYETLQKAKKEKISVGKMEIYQRLQVKDEEDVSLEKIKTQQIKELIRHEEKKEHPVFEKHPSNKEDKEHPVFEKHPGSKEGKQQPVVEDKSSKKEEKSNKKEEKQHPVFENHPGNKENKKNSQIESQPIKDEEKVDVKKEKNKIEEVKEEKELEKPSEDNNKEKEKTNQKKKNEKVKK